MKHSNNAARIRLWRELKPGMDDAIERRVVAYPDLKSPEFAAINPLKKVPAFIRADGTCVFESAVILNYLEDKYGDAAPSFKPPTAEGRQLMELFIRIHDLYIASPNCTAPGFSHCQGAMYLSYGWHGCARGMDLPTRAAKLAEIWKQLSWLEGYMTSPFLAGGALSLADFTWYPTMVFMEFLLPRVLDWPSVVDPAASSFPRIAAWFVKCTAIAEFKRARDQIYTYWEEMEAKGQFKPIKDEIAADTEGHKLRYP